MTVRSEQDGTVAILTINRPDAMNALNEAVVEQLHAALRRAVSAPEVRGIVIGGAGLIGSHIVDELLKTDVGEVIVYDNFFRGSRENLKEALQ
ncbi:MAG: enoyl-CoA hydratase-related protein, partial [Myxococcota bacterium]